MQFSDTTNRTGLIQDCEDLLNLGAATISGDSTLLKTFTRYINFHYQKTVNMILMTQDDWDWDDSNQTDYAVATTPLVAAQRDYVFPTSLKILKIKRVDVTYDGSTYYKCEPFDSGETGLGLGNDTNTDARFTISQPAYDIRGNAIWLYPEANSSQVTAGGLLRIEFQREPIEFATSDTTATPGIDKPFHRMLSLGAAFDYALSKDMPRQQTLASLAADLEERLIRHYSKKDDDRELILKPNYVNYN